MNEYYIDTTPDGQPISPSIILANKNGEKIGVLNIDETSLVIKVELEDAKILNSEFSCDIHKYINTFVNPMWDLVKNFKMLCIPINIPHIQAKSLWYEFEVTIDEDDETIKHLTGTLAQYAELSQCYNYDIEIRTEADMARDDYEDTIFYNPNNPDASIVHRILHDKASHYTIVHVDDSLKNVKRTFSFNGTTVIDCLKDLAEEVDCIVTFGEFNGDDDLQLQRTISFYDAKDYCPVCGKRGDFTDGCTNPECPHTQKIVPRYGTDTGIFISHENLGENINLSTNIDNIKNCFRVTAGDDIMTTAVVLCNPAKSRYIWRFTNEMKADMSSELAKKLNKYEEEYQDYRYIRLLNGITKISDYNTIYDKYEPYLKDKMGNLPTLIRGYTKLIQAYYYTIGLRDFLSTTMLPDSPDVIDTTAAEQLALFTQTDIGVRSIASLTKTVIESEIKDAVKLYCDDARYKIDVVTASYADKIWNGTITLTSYSDDEDTATGEYQLTFSQATSDFIKSQVDKYIKRKESIISGAKDLLKLELIDFKGELRKYNLNSLSIIRDTIQAVLNILDDAGITQSTNPDVYEDIYKPYSDKLSVTQAEIAVRDEEVTKLDALLNEITTVQDRVNTVLDLKSYLGDELWLELISFRREAEQSDSTIISTGLTDAEIMENAQEFFNRMDEDIDKMAESQYTIDCTLKDLLLMLPDTYSEIVPMFDVGNWIRIEVDEKIYKMRLLSYEIDFDDLTTIQTEFSSARISNDIYSSFNQVKKTAENANQGLADISKQVDINNLTTEIVNQISNHIYTPDNTLVASIRGGSIMMDDDETLEEYLRRSIKDTNGNLAITLTNEFQGIATDEDGDGGDYSDCQSQVIVYYGSDNITDSPEITWDVIIPNTVTGAWDENTHTVSISNVSRDAGVIEIFVEYRGLEVKKSFIVKKIKQGTSPITVNIESSAGNIFKNRGISTTLTCTVLKGNKDITDTVTNFHWIKYDMNGDLDETWSRMNARTIQITPADLWSKGIFKCEVSFD